MTQRQHSILLVEDEEPIRMALRRVFSRKGWVVTEALDGVEALELLLAPEGERYDVVLSDLQMPGMTGAKLFERVDSERPALARRMIFSSGDIFSDDAQALISKSGCTVIEKPFDLAALVALAEKMAAA